MVKSSLSFVFFHVDVFSQQCSSTVSFSSDVTQSHLMQNRQHFTQFLICSLLWTSYHF